MESDVSYNEHNYPHKSNSELCVRKRANCDAKNDNSSVADGIGKFVKDAELEGNQLLLVPIHSGMMGDIDEEARENAKAKLYALTANIEKDAAANSTHSSSLNHSSQLSSSITINNKIIDDIPSSLSIDWNPAAQAC